MDPDETVEVTDQGDVTEAPEEQVVEVGVDPYSEDRLMPAGSNTPPQFIQDQGEGNAEVEARLVKIAQASKDRGTFENDRKWYETEGDRTRRKARELGISEEDFIAVTAHLSPKMLWERTNPQGETEYINLAAAERAVQLHRLFPDMDPHNIVKMPAGFEGVTGLPKNYSKAIMHLRGNPSHYGPKTGNFAANLTDPEGTRDMVTIDTLMASALAGRPLGKNESYELNQITRVKKTDRTPGGYGWAQRRIHEAAKVVGITPQELQAVVWSEWRRTLS